MEYPLFTDCISSSLSDAIEELNPDRVFILTDSNVIEAVRKFEPRLLQDPRRRIIVIPAGEENKNLESLAYIWQQLAGASRDSLLCCLGGGMVCDIGGFAASTFKRGIRHINIPTTLLADCDAALGGKTGIDFNGAKNEIGSFAMPCRTIISPAPLSTLPDREFRSGLGEMMKTALIADATLFRSMLDPETLLNDIAMTARLAKKCAEIKCSVVEKDPHEKNIRKILNFGHTAGHALEALMLKRKSPVTHGEAVAHGCLIALILSHTVVGMPSSIIHSFASLFLKPLFRPLPITCDDYPELLRLMARDKKNRVGSNPRFILLSDIGKPLTDCIPDPKMVKTALDIYRDISH